MTLPIHLYSPMSSDFAYKINSRGSVKKGIRAMLKQKLTNSKRENNNSCKNENSPPWVLIGPTREDDVRGHLVTGYRYRGHSGQEGPIAPTKT